MKLKPYPKYKDSGIQWIGGIPEEWEVRKLKHICTKYAEYGLNISSDNYQTEGIRFIRTTDIDDYGNLKNGGVYLNKSLCKGYILNSGDLLISRSGTIGRTFLFNSEKNGEATYAGYLVRFSINKNKATPGYVFYFTKTNSFYRWLEIQSIETTIENVNGQKYANLLLTIPPLPDQIAIANFLDKKTAKINSMIEKVKKIKDLMKEERLSLVGQAILDKKLPRIRIQHLVENISRPIHRKDEEVYISLGLYNWARGIFHKTPTTGGELGDSSFYFVKEGDLIISGQFAWEGAVAIAGHKEENCIVSHRFHVLKGKKGKLYTEYLWTFFTSERGDFILNESSIGSAGRNRPLTINRLMKEKISVPTLELQEKVIKIVEKEKELDILYKKFTELLEEYKKSLIHYVVIGKVDVRGVEA